MDSCRRRTSLAYAPSSVRGSFRRSPTGVHLVKNMLRSQTAQEALLWGLQPVSTCIQVYVMKVDGWGRNARKHDLCWHGLTGVTCSGRCDKKEADTILFLKQTTILQPAGRCVCVDVCLNDSLHVLRVGARRRLGKNRRKEMEVASYFRYNMRARDRTKNPGCVWSLCLDHVAHHFSRQIFPFRSRPKEPLESTIMIPKCRRHPFEILSFYERFILITFKGKIYSPVLLSVVGVFTDRLMSIALDECHP